MARGRVINVSSLGGRMTLPSWGATTRPSTRSIALGRAARRAGAVRREVSLIEPGVIDTGFADRSVSEAGKYDPPDPPYRPVLHRMDEIRRMSDPTAVGPECIAQAIERAATAPAPSPLRGTAARRPDNPLRALPTAISDALLRLAFGLTRRRFRAVTDGRAPALDQAHNAAPRPAA